MIMIRIVISWTYYKENVYFSSRNARQKKECVFFYDYDEFMWYIIQHMDYSDLQKLRLAIYKKYHDLIKFTRFIESNKDWDKFEWYHLQSPIIDIPTSEFAEMLPNTYKKKYFVFDNVREKYFLKSDFINYVHFHV